MKSPVPEREVFFLEETQRPDVGWMNYEGVAYHDLYYDDFRIDDSPELSAFLHRSHVFNRAMRWIRSNECILCVSDSGNLQLTGSAGVSEWLTGSLNEVSLDGNCSIFESKSLRRRDAAVLPNLQFHVGQHPILSVRVDETNAEWQIVVAVKGRGGEPLFVSDWYSGAQELTVDLAGSLAVAGYERQFAELIIALVTWVDDPAPVRLRFDAALKPSATIVLPLPIVREVGSPFSVIALILDEEGRPTFDAAEVVHASLGTRQVQLEPDETAGFWHASCPAVEAGEHVFRVVLRSGDERRSTVRVVEATYYEFDVDRNAVTLDGVIQGPLTGSYQGGFFVQGGALVQGSERWADWVATGRDGEDLLYWEALTPGELDSRFAFLSGCGWDLLYLSQHYGFWEKLDAGGRIAPAGAEQLGLYLQIAARHELRVIQALTIYPYMAVLGRAPHLQGTPPESSYLAWGFTDDQWADPSSPFTEHWYGYLSDFVRLFGIDPTLFALSMSGEGDFLAGPERVNATQQYVAALGDRHIFLCEPIHETQKIPDEQCANFSPPLRGGRTYFLGHEIEPEVDLGVEFKLFQLGRVYMAEGSWAPSHRYVRLHHELGTERGSEETWTGTQRYRVRLRDSLYLAFVHGLPIVMTWDEASAEDEHRILAEARTLIDWSIPMRRPPLIVRVDNANAVGEGRRRLAAVEDLCQRRSVGYALTRTSSENVWFDATDPAAILKMADDIRTPLEISPGYGASLFEQENRTLAAYIFNRNGKPVEQPQWLAGRLHRSPSPTRLSLRSFDVQENRICVWDLDRQQIVHDAPNVGDTTIELGMTDHDYLVLRTRI